MELKEISIKNVPADILKKAQDIARQNDRTLSQVIRELMREYVATQGKSVSK